MSYAQAAPNVNALNLGVQLNTVSAHIRTQPKQVYCAPTYDPFCETEVLLGGKCNKQDQVGIPTFPTGCSKPNINTNTKKIQ